ncbi:DUF6468 domain-containing protein [Govanella unica]|uniref:DUF6468 domain-containing protein n=1 Tax=Govanella unica TaxID=2975056 RepID=A0A9X3TWI3_9PROT|nr:DUF6468 domain-containing protein [Govania unica]MDA5193221.1 DUF6468 domain-containing protein [Govania unica]
MMSFDLIANIVVALLLVATIGFAIVLNRRLQSMKDEQEVMARLISGLNLATAKAQESIYELRAVAQSTEDTLKHNISDARALADELQMITQAGSNLAAKIEAGLTARKQADMSVPRAPQARAAKARTSWTKEEEEDTDGDLGSALRAVR